MLLRRGQRIEPGERIVVVEDVVTTGGSAREVAVLAREAGATVEAVAALVDRSPSGADPAAPAAPAQPDPAAPAVIARLRVKAATWPADACPLCAAGAPVDSPGSRRQADS
jgi:orotate phosphoribosyltransferase